MSRRFCGHGGEIIVAAITVLLSEQAFERLILRTPPSLKAFLKEYDVNGRSKKQVAIIMNEAEMV